MRGVAWGASVVIAAAAIACGAQPIFAQASSGRDNAEHFLLFSGADLWRGGGFGYGGLIWSPGGLDREGFAAKLLVGAGQYRYRSGAAEIVGTELLVDAMPGWRFKFRRGEITVMAGLDLQNHRLSPDDLGNRLRGSHAGLRAGVDLWWEPTDATMLSAGGTFATIGDGYWARGAVGWRFFERVYLGPEALALGDTSYWQWRVGLHATALRLGGFEWSAGAGFVADSAARSGVYGRLGVLMRR